MKRLWIRLSAVAGVVVALGGGGYYFLVNGASAASEESKKVIAKAEESKPRQSAVPLKDEKGAASPAFGGESGEFGGVSGDEYDGEYGGVSREYGGASGEFGESGSDEMPPARPANAAWQGSDDPTIRRVSVNDPDGMYGSSDLRPGEAPAVEPLAADGERIYDPSRSYGDMPAAPQDEYAPNIPARVVAAEDYPTNAAIDEVPKNYGAPEYGPVSADGSSFPRPDPHQPVVTPQFANSDAVDTGGSVSDGEAPDVNTLPPAGTPIYEPSYPTSDPADALSSPGVLREPLPGAEYPSGLRGPTYLPTPAFDPTGTPAGNVSLVAATPGDRSLDGRQTPAVSFEKIAPTETQVGKPAVFKTLLRNTSDVTARNVVVTDRAPQGTQLIDATPRPVQAPDGSLVWSFESLAPGEEILISMEVMPQVEGELGSLARLTFEAQASVRTICTKPQLLVEHSTDPQVLIGETVVFAITISNPGSGDATGIILEEDVPPGLSHGAGTELEYEVGTLRPGESRRLELKLKASKAGVTINKLRVRGDANLSAEHATQLEVIAPKLVVGLTGPRRRFLDRQVKYQVAFHNAGTANARNVELATFLPKGLKFVSTSGKGQYDTRDHAVYWSLDQLAPGQAGEVELVALPIATGEQKLQIEGTADLGLLNSYEHITVVEAITELVFTVSDTQDPIEVGSETMYEIRIVNEGSKTATNVQLDAFLPVALTAISGEGTTRVAIQGQQVLMESLPRLAPGEEAVYKIKVKGRQAGDHLIDVRLVCDEVPTPVTKQESTKVYADEI